MEQSSLSGLSHYADGGAPARVYPDCILFEQPIPARLFNACSQLFPNGLVSPCLARFSGATVAIGTEAGIDRLCAFYRPLYLEKMRRFTEQNGLPDSAAIWLSGDDVGASSLSLFYRLTGIEPPGLLDQSAHPYELADFRRCCLLLEALPDHRGQLPVMAAVSDEWSLLVDSWSRISASLDRECPDWRDSLSGAPDTRKLFRAALFGNL